MHPVLSIGFYLLFQIFIMLQSVWCLKINRFFSVECSRREFLLMTGTVLFLIFSLFPVAGAILPDSRIKFSLQAAGNIFLGFTLYFNLLMVFLSLLMLIIDLIRGDSRTIQLKGAVFLISFITGACLLLYGMVHAQQTIVTRYDLRPEENAFPRADLKLILIGDLHLCVNSRLDTIQRMVEMINQENADVVLVAGDIFTSSYNGLRDPDKYAASLRQIKAQYGVYAVYGNHDVEETLFGGFPISPVSEAFRPAEMEQFLRECHFTVLRDETATIAGGTVQITGRVDGQKAGDGTAIRKSPAEVLSGADDDAYQIVLEHEPVEFAALKESGADLALCGHTHAGQIFPGNLIVPFFNENAYGYKNVSGLDTFVTSGIGYYGPPMRVGTDSEIVVITL